MTRLRPTSTEATPGRWLLVLFMLLGLLLQFGLQSFATAGETPRSALLRVTGIDIAPAGFQPSDHHEHTVEAGTRHHHAMEASGSAARHAPGPPQPHRHDATCPLCPLLLVFGVILGTGAFLPLVTGAWLSIRRVFAQPRAPPLIILVLPPATGPPYPI